MKFYIRIDVRKVSETVSWSNFTQQLKTQPSLVSLFTPWKGGWGYAQHEFLSAHGLYSSDPAEEELFRNTLAQRIAVDFMGDVDYFLGTAFTWRRHDDEHVSVHLCQSAFTEFTAQRFGVDKMNQTPNMTPYRSGMPIDSIPAPDPIAAGR